MNTNKMIYAILINFYIINKRTLFLNTNNKTRSSSFFFEDFEILFQIT